jgi:hypothetical protein
MRRLALSLPLLFTACAGTDGATGSVTGLTVGDSNTETGTGGPEETTTANGSTGGGSGTSMSPTTGSSGITTLPTTTTDDSSGGNETTSDDTSGTTGSEASWHRYARDMTTGTWTSVPLDELWEGANAPPAQGITAAVSFTHFDRLFVIANGVVFEQTDGVWQPPQPLGTRFPAAAGATITAIAHTPGQNASDVEDLFLIETPFAHLYQVFENGNITFNQTADLEDSDGGAPQASVVNNWTLNIADPSGIGMDADWLVWYMGFANGDLWRFNAAFEWQQSPGDNNVFFNGAAGEPDPFDIRAAYYDDAFERAYFIAP